LPTRNSIYRAIYLKSLLALFPLKLTVAALSNPNLKSLLALGLTEKLVYKSIVNPKPFLAALSAIENLNTLLPSYTLGSIAHSAVLGAIANLKSPPVQDIGIGI